MRRACDAWAVQGGARGAAALSAGAGAAAAARASAPLHYRAALPSLAAYSAAHLDKIRARDGLHAAYVSGNTTGDDTHNRLEQASEALRSELSDWIPKTRTEIKDILLELANRQVNIHTQTLMGWENALKLSLDDISQMFKTVSKTAVQNLSPSKCRTLTTPNETERDLDDMDVISNYSDVQDVRNDDMNGISNEEIKNNYSDIRNNDDINGLNNEETNNDDSNKTNVNDENSEGTSKSYKLDSVKDDSSKSDKFSDPLQEFSEVDLS